MTRKHLDFEHYVKQTLALIAKNNLDGPPLTTWRLSCNVEVNLSQMREVVAHLLKNRLIIKHIVKSPLTGEYRITYLITELGIKYLEMLNEMYEMLA